MIHLRQVKELLLNAVNRHLLKSEDRSGPPSLRLDSSLGEIISLA